MDEFLSEFLLELNFLVFDWHFWVRNDFFWKYYRMNKLEKVDFNWNQYMSLKKVGKKIKRTKNFHFTHNPNINQWNDQN